MPMTIVPRYAWIKNPYPPVPFLLFPVKFVFQDFPTREYNPEAPSPGPRPSSPVAFREAHYLERLAVLANHDIQYNFLIGTDGYVYEGRGWELTPLLPTKYHYWGLHSLYIALLGDFRDEPPPDEMYQLRDEFLRYGVECCYIKPTFKLISLAESNVKQKRTMSNLMH